MKQTKKDSLKETLTSTFIGFLVSYLSTFLIFHLLGIESGGGKNLIITIYFTVVSIIRGYLVRRYFNNKKYLNKKITNNYKKIKTMKYLGSKNRIAKHKKQEKNGWVRGMYKPEKAGQYLIEDINGKSVAEYDGYFWEEKVSHLLCWTFIHPHELDAPF